MIRYNPQGYISPEPLTGYYTARSYAPQDDKVIFIWIERQEEAVSYTSQVYK